MKYPNNKTISEDVYYKFGCFLNLLPKIHDKVRGIQGSKK